MNMHQQGNTDPSSQGETQRQATAPADSPMDSPRLRHRRYQPPAEPASPTEAPAPAPESTATEAPPPPPADIPSRFSREAQDKASAGLGLLQMDDPLLGAIDYLNQYSILGVRQRPAGGKPTPTERADPPAGLSDLGTDAPQGSALRYAYRSPAAQALVDRIAPLSKATQSLPDRAHFKAIPARYAPMVAASAQNPPAAKKHTALTVVLAVLGLAALVMLLVFLLRVIFPTPHSSGGVPPKTQTAVTLRASAAPTATARSAQAPAKGSAKPVPTRTVAIAMEAPPSDIPSPSALADGATTKTPAVADVVTGGSAGQPSPTPPISSSPAPTETPASATQTATPALPALGGNAYQQPVRDVVGNTWLTSQSDDYSPAMLNDSREETCWQYSTKNLDDHAQVELLLSQAGRLNALWIKNGFWKVTDGFDQYPRNGRLKKIEISYRYLNEPDFRDPATYTLKDDKAREHWQVVDIGLHENVDAVRIRVLSIYKGSKFKTDVAVSEMMLVLQP